MAKQKIRKGDTVEVIAGLKNRLKGRDDQGKRGEVISVDPKKGLIVVSGLNVRKKHKKPQPGQQGPAGNPQIVEFDAPLPLANVMMVDPKSGKPTRVGFKKVGEKTVRVAKVSGEPLDK